MSKIYNSLKILSIISLLIGGLHIHEHEFHGHFEADEYEITCIHCDLIKNINTSNDTNTPDFFDEYHQLTQQFFSNLQLSNLSPKRSPDSPLNKKIYFKGEIL